MTVFARAGTVVAMRPHDTRPRPRLAATCAALLAVLGVSTAAIPAAALPTGPLPAGPVAGSPAAPGSAAAPGSLAATSRPALDRAARRVVAAGAAGYLAHVRDGRRVTTARAGLADRGTSRPIGVDDQFEIGSNTKTFTSVVVLQLVARGEMSLEDTVEDHLPGLVPGGDAITVRRLLNHTSGIYNVTADEPFMTSVSSGSDRLWTPRELVQVAVRHRPDFAPGEGWNYSNTNYILAGMIAEKVSGRSLAHLVEHRIARPLGLERTYLVTDRVRSAGPGYAHGYIAHFTGAGATYTDVTHWPIGGWAGAAGAIVSTPSELATFFSAVLRGRLLPAAQRAEMRRLEPVPDEWAASGVEGYGLGLMRYRTPCGPAWGHGGDTLGHHSTAMVTGDGRRVAVTDTTTQPDADTPAARELAAAVTAADTAATCLMLGRPVPR